MLFDIDKRFLNWYGLSYVHENTDTTSVPYILYTVSVNLFTKTGIDVKCAYTTPPHYVDLEHDESLEKHYLTANGIGYWLDSSNGRTPSSYASQIQDTRRYLNYYGFEYLWNTTLDPSLLDDGSEEKAARRANDEDVVLKIDEETGEIIIDVDEMNTLYGGYDFLLSATNGGLLQIYFDEGVTNASYGEMDPDSGDISIYYDVA